MQNAKNQIRTRRQYDTPFFPNMLNNGAVEVCLKEDVDKALAEKDAENERLKERSQWHRQKDKDLINKLKYELSHIPVRTIVVVDEKEMSWEGPQKFYPKQSVDNAINRVFNDTKAF